MAVFYLQRRIALTDEIRKLTIKDCHQPNQSVLAPVSALAIDKFPKIWIGEVNANTCKAPTEFCDRFYSSARHHVADVEVDLANLDRRLLCLC